jgi:tripartite-type tricarboxylate transporter receptor subunit TctC
VAADSLGGAGIGFKRARACRTAVIADASGRGDDRVRGEEGRMPAPGKAKPRMGSRRRIALALAGTLALVGAARAQTPPEPGYPDRPVRLIVAGGPGSGQDVTARAVAARLGDPLRQPVVVENIPSGGAVGISTAARTRRDGTVLLSAVSGILLGPILDPSLPYDVFRDFTPVSQLHSATSALVVGAGVPARSVAEFVALVRAAPGRYDLGNFGHGSSSHLDGELFNRRTGLTLQAVPFQGGAALVRDLVAGHICCGVIDTGSVRAQLAAGTLRALAVTGPARSPLLPEVPAFVELGGFDGFEPQIWQGLFLPAGTPPEFVAVYGRAVAAAVRHPETAETIRNLGFQPLGSTPEEFAAMLRREAPIWRRIVEETGIRIRRE